MSRRARAWAAAPLLLAAVVVAAVLLRGGDEEDAAGGAVVPYVVGLDEDAATGQLLANGFSTRVERRPSDEPPGRVLGQDPDAGRRRPTGAVILIVVSGNPTDTVETPQAGPVEVPDLVGGQQVEVGAELEELGLAADTRAVSSDRPCGEVVAQSVAAGETVDAGSIVVLDVSTGPDELFDVQVPDLVGLTEVTARAHARELGFAVTTRRQRGSPPNGGRVISQRPEPGRLAREFSPLTIAVG